MHMLTSARGNLAQHYRNLNSYQRDGLPAASMDMKFWQIDEAIFDEFLDMLPPVYAPHGFQMSEKLTGDLAAYYAKVGEQHWCGYCTGADLLKLHGRMAKAAAR
jgi:hypothetical protein